MFKIIVDFIVNNSLTYCVALKPYFFEAVYHQGNRLRITASPAYWNRIVETKQGKTNVKKGFVVKKIMNRRWQNDDKRLPSVLF